MKLTQKQDMILFRAQGKVLDAMELLGDAWSNEQNPIAKTAEKIALDEARSLFRKIFILRIETPLIEKPDENEGTGAKEMEIPCLPGKHMGQPLPEITPIYAEKKTGKKSNPHQEPSKCHSPTEPRQKKVR